MSIFYTDGNSMAYFLAQGRSKAELDDLERRRVDMLASLCDITGALAAEYFWDDESNTEAFWFTFHKLHVPSGFIPIEFQDERSDGTLVYLPEDDSPQWEAIDLVMARYRNGININPFMLGAVDVIFGVKESSHQRHQSLINVEQRGENRVIEVPIKEDGLPLIVPEDALRIRKDQYLDFLHTGNVGFSNGNSQGAVVKNIRKL